MSEQWVMEVLITGKADANAVLQSILAKKPIPIAYLQSFDPDGNAGYGEIILTGDIDDAQRFASFLDVMEEWKRQSRTVPLRDDGKPNRPLTAYSIHPLML